MARKSVGKPIRAERSPAAPGAVPAAGSPGESGGIQPWHLLLLGTLLAVTATLFVTAGTSTINVVFVAVATATAALAAAGLYRTLAPLVMADAGEQTDMLAGRTRAALEREKFLVLRSIKEVEFDRAMRKISEADYREMVGRLRSRAAGLMRQLDGGGLGYRDLIERELAARIGPTPPPAPAAAAPEKRPPAPGHCPACEADNDADARFCKACGTKLGLTS